MELLVPIAAKSFLVAGAALLLLRLAARRSAAERSWIAHLGLAVLLLLPVAALVLPKVPVPAPGFLALPAAETVEAPVAPVVQRVEAKEVPSTAGASFPQAASPVEPAASVDWVSLAYAVPAVLLFLLTLIALGRLFSLRGRAEVLVEPHWLTALAHAQRRMRFKHGTALLTSDELPSPISWGLMRPVILLNSEAARSHEEAEAIIAHELAHVANLDWAKLLVSRIATAIFWFNPLVWLLAREAHQLREEAADDAVLGADIADTDYAQLLVGVARHECRGLLIGAHGVAPSRNSLARRVRRVLDSGSARGPAARPFAAGVFVGALAFAAPLAAVTLTPQTGADSQSTDSGEPYYVGSGDEAVEAVVGRTVPSVVADTVPGVVSNAVTAAVSGALTAHPHPGWTEADEKRLEKQIEKAIENGWNGIGPIPGTVGPRPGTVGPRPRVTAPKSAIDVAIEMKAVGLTSEYMRSLRAASPRLANLPSSEFVSLAALGVSPQYIRDLAAAGYGNLDAEQLTEAKAVGVSAAFARDLAAAGYRGLSLDELVELRAVGVTGEYIQLFRRSGHTGLTVDQLVEMRALGISPEDLYGDKP